MSHEMTVFISESDTGTANTVDEFVLAAQGFAKRYNGVSTAAAPSLTGYAQTFSFAKRPERVACIGAILEAADNNARVRVIVAAGNMSHVIGALYRMHL